MRVLAVSGAFFAGVRALGAEVADFALFAQATVAPAAERVPSSGGWIEAQTAWRFAALASLLAFAGASLLAWRIARQARQLRARNEAIRKEVSERTEAQRQSRDSQNRLALVLDAANLGLWDRRVPTGELVVNRQWGAILGYGPDELPANYEAWKSLLHPEDLPRAIAALNNHAEQQTPSYQCEYRMRTRAGGWKWILARGRVMERDAEDRPLRIVGTHLDITDRKEAEERYSLLFGTMLYGFALHEIVCDEQGRPVDFRYLEVNPAFVRLTGLTEEQVVGKRVRELLPATEDYWIEMFGEVALTGVPRNFENRFEALRRYYEGVAFSPQRGRFAVIFRDVTERQEAEQERHRVEAALQRSQKLESLGVLAGGIAHDFNNLLMGILGNAELAKDGVPIGCHAQSCLDEIALAGKRAAEVCRQMLAYAGRGPYVLGRLDLNQTIESIAGLLRLSVGKTAVLRFDYGHDLPPILADGSQVRQIAVNLVTNAAEAIGPVSGIVHVTTGAQDCTRAYLNECMLGEDRAESAYAFLEVSDTGVGIEPNLLPRIFDPFFSTKFPGRGLGLAAVLGIVRSHGGAIRVTSVPTRGTAFRVLFPLAPPASVAPPGEPVPAVGAPRGARGAVLFVDDDETVRTVGRRILDKAGFDVLLATDGREAVKVFGEQADAIAVVVLDLTMPHMSGVEAFRELRKIRAGVPILVCSGYTVQEMAERFREVGASAFLQKPYPAEALVARLEGLLSG